MTLKELRVKRGLSPSFVAKKLKITYRHFNRIENSGKFLTEDRIVTLANLYNVKTSEIMKCGGDEDKSVRDIRSSREGFKKSQKEKKIKIIS